MRTHLAAIMRGDAPSPEGLHAAVPEAVVDALIETVWDHQNLRLAFARLTPDKRLRFLACACGGDMPEISGCSLHLERATAFRDLLRSADGPVAVEDVTTNSNTKALRPQFDALGTGALLALPIRGPDGEVPLGVLFFDSATPRTWTPKEVVSLERLAPMIALAIDNAMLREKLTRASADLSDYERRLDAVRGVVDGVVHDTSVLVGALISLIRGIGADLSDRMELDKRSAEAVGRQVEAVLDELATLGHHSAASPELVDAGELVDQLAPALRAVAGHHVRLLCRRHAHPVPVRIHRSALERALLNVVVHARSLRPAGREFVIEAMPREGHAEIAVYGDALGIDAALLAVGRADSAALQELHIGLWLAYCGIRTDAGHIEVKGTDALDLRVLVPLAT